MPDLLTGNPITGVDVDALALAEAQVVGYCGWHIAPSITETVILNGSGVGTISLPSLKVSAITSVIVDGDTIDTDDYEWSGVGFIRLARRWIRDGLRNVSVTFTHGYDECPPEVRAVVARIAQAGFVTDQRIRTKTTGPFSVTYFDDGASGGIDTYSAAILDRYALPGAA